MKFRRLQAGYYYSTKTANIQGINSHVVIECSDGGTYWILRIEELPALNTIHQSYTHCKFALTEMTNGNLELALQ